MIYGMNARTKKVLDDARALPASERELIVTELSAELDAEGPPEDVAKAWDDEIRRRVDEVISGRAKTVDMREAMAELRARYARR
jgi:putative addiction module component (TIGR02574 family)